MAIEAGTTEAVAKAADPEAIARLQENLDEERQLRQQGHTRKAIHLSGGFHVLMAKLSGNRVLAEQVRLLVARTSLIVNLFDNQIGLAGWHDHHDELISHCAAGRVDKAVLLMREHIMELQDSLALDRRRPVAFDMMGVFGTSRLCGLHHCLARSGKRLDIGEILRVTPAALTEQLPGFLSPSRHDKTGPIIGNRFEKTETEERRDRLVAHGLFDSAAGDNQFPSGRSPFGNSGSKMSTPSRLVAAP
jgi:hypothetical protein